jgi:hypothetical protein
MSEIKDGGPAFPRNILDHGHGVTTVHESGMTLRDYFAAKAMQGLITSLHSKPYPEWQTAEWISESAYGIADAMLKARGNK